jgi:hypothetical protein
MYWAVFWHVAPRSLVEKLIDVSEVVTASIIKAMSNIPEANYIHIFDVYTRRNARDEWKAVKLAEVNAET